MAKPRAQKNYYLLRAADWYIERIDYGRPKPWLLMYWLYRVADHYVNG